MSEKFTPITTQEQFDAAVQDRVKREQNKFKGYLSPEDVEEKYKGYMSEGDVQKKYEGYMSQEDVEKKYAGYISKDEADKKDAKIKQYEVNSIKAKVAREHGIPFEMADRLSGEDEESLKKDAENLAKIIKSNRGSAMLKTDEITEKDNKRAAYKNMLSEMEGE